MEKAAIVTGASSGIGLAISRVLCELGFKVFGFGRDFRELETDQGMKHWMHSERFHPVACDLLDTENMLAQVRRIRSEENIFLLVNNAGVGYYGLHEELNPQKIQNMVRTNLELPMILTNQLLRDLKKHAGTIINVSSITASGSNPHGCAYGATKAGLTSFSHSLFQEARKYGIQVVNLQPDMTKTKLYRNADFAEGEEPDSYLLPEEVGEAVRYVLQQRSGIAVTDLTLRPQIHRIRRKE